jgi:diadenylate cyclase
MRTYRFGKRLRSFIEGAISLHTAVESNAILVMMDGRMDYAHLAEAAGETRVIIAADFAEELEGAEEAGLKNIALNSDHSPVYEKLTQALLECVAREWLQPGSSVVAVYSLFDSERFDTISLVPLDEHLGRLTPRDLRELETSVPLDTLKAVVDLAVEIGREGREGKPVGTMFVVGDTRKVLSLCQSSGFDPVKGYKREERNLNDRRVREAIKEIAQLDGAFVVATDGTVEKSCQIVEASHGDITSISAGLGARHWSAAAISKETSAIAIVVSESNGTVRLFLNGMVVLRVEPHRRPMKWKDVQYDQSPAEPKKVEPKKVEPKKVEPKKTPVTKAELKSE